jgi:hypothetical protein
LRASPGDPCPLLHFRGMNDGDTGITLEIVSIEAEDLAYLLHHHCRNDSGIVDLNSRYSVVKHKLSPSWENVRRLWKESQERLKAIHVSSCLFGREAEPVTACRACRGTPEFDKVLRKAEKLLTLAVERLYCRRAAARN